MIKIFSGRGVDLYRGDGVEGCEALGEAAPGCVDLFLSDPPYGMAWTGREGDKAIRADGSRQGMRVVRSVLEALSRALSPDAHLYAFCHWESYPDFGDVLSAHCRPKNALVWEKGTSGMGCTRTQWAPSYELIIYAQRGAGRDLAWPEKRLPAVLSALRDDRFKPVPSARRIHPTEKPVGLLQHLITVSCPPGGLVVDPFAGSASTLEAAMRSGRRAVGFEVDPAHADAAADRLAAVEAEIDNNQGRAA